MATVAVFLALGGGAYAAITLPKNSVGTKQIKSNAVISSKIKNGSLLSKDFKAGQLPAGLQGPKGDAGATGPPGATGATGLQGPIGPSDAFVASAQSVTVVGFNNTVVSKTVPAGKYVINAKLRAQSYSNVAERTFDCRLLASSPYAELDTARADLAAEFTPGFAEMVVLQGWLQTDGPNTVTVECAFPVPSGSGDAQAFDAKLTLIKVGNIS
jgi:hypothetical protein